MRLVVVDYAGNILFHDDSGRQRNLVMAENH